MSGEVFEVDIDHNEDPTKLPLWYEQLLRLDERSREHVKENALKRLRAIKPDTYEFIKKFKCELIGISPRVEYVLLKESEGDIDVTFIHPYSMPTLLFWCPAGEFHFSVNANLKFNDTVLNNVKGNKIDRKIRGLTG
ncbi:MAG: hypothetical protein HC883_00200 [Bdellovibrionaceae bacterium]|nr:hypothetical protein [Pseudobdellovibrionaceae bacterium]